MNKFEPGEKVRLGKSNEIKGLVKNIDRVGESEFDTLYMVEIPSALGEDIIRIRGSNLSRGICPKHGSKSVYNERKEEWFCPFCNLDNE